MSGPPKTALQHEPLAEEHDEHDEHDEHAKPQAHTEQVALRDGRSLTVTEVGVDQLVEIRSESGLLEVRIRLTSEGPVLQMESVRLELKASEAVQIESRRVEIKGNERLDLKGGKIVVHGKEEVEVEADGDVRVVGKMIHLN